MSSSLMLWTAAFAGYLRKTYDASQQAAASRRHNADCELLHFFDYHDCWHLASAAAALAAFLALLLLDEALGAFPAAELRAAFRE